MCMVKFLPSIICYLQVPSSVLHLAITALCQLSSEWSMQQEHTQQKALAILKWLLQHLSMQPSSRLLAKALLIQLLLLAGQALDDIVILDFEEADFILAVLSHSTVDPHCPCSVGEAMQLLKYLIEYAPNKLILTDRNILDPLANLVDSEQGKDQECAAELISTLLIDPPSASDEVETKTCQMAMLPEMTGVNPSTNTTYPAGLSCMVSLSSLIYYYSTVFAYELILPLIRCVHVSVCACITGGQCMEVMHLTLIMSQTLAHLSIE